MANYYNRNTELVDQSKNFVQITPGGDMRVAEPVRIAGATFSGTTVDPNFWTTTIVGSATATQANGQMTIATGATANSTITVTSTETARYVGEATNLYTGLIQLGDTGTVNNARSWGAFNTTDGCFFQVNGTTLYACTMAGGVLNAVPQHLWNGILVNVNLTSSNNYSIVYTATRAIFYINHVVVHTITGVTAPYTNNYDLPVATSNVNSNGLATNLTISTRSNVIQRLGKVETQPKYVNITTADTVIAKYGPGTLHNVVVNTGTSDGTGTITLYDSLTASGTTIATITVVEGLAATLTYDITFYNGLTILTSEALDVTITYE